MKAPSRHLLPMPRHSRGPGADGESATGAQDSIPQAHYGKRPARWTDDRAMLEAVTGALAEAEQRLCELVRDDPAPPAGLVSLFVKDVTRLRREEQLIRDRVVLERDLRACLRGALATRRLKPLLRCLASRLR